MDPEVVGLGNCRHFQNDKTRVPCHAQAKTMVNIIPSEQWTLKKLPLPGKLEPVREGPGPAI